MLRLAAVGASALRRRLNVEKIFMIEPQSWDVTTWSVAIVFVVWTTAMLTREILPFEYKRWMVRLDPFWLVPSWKLFPGLPADFVILLRDACHEGSDDGWVEVLGCVQASLSNFWLAPATRREDMARRLASRIYRSRLTAKLTSENQAQDLGYRGLLIFLAPLAHEREADRFQFAIDHIRRSEGVVVRKRVFVSAVHATSGVYLGL